MKKYFTFLIIVTLSTHCTHAQMFQKAFGMNQPNQQEIYDLTIDSNNSIYTSGTYRNIDYFPDPNFFGTLSKLNPSGSLSWFKAYLPTDSVPFDSFFINSLIQTDDNSLYGFGVFLGGSNEKTGYILIKFDGSGQVIWAKFINSSYEVFSHAVYGNNAIYGILRDKIIKFDLNGEIVNSVSIAQESDITLRKACITSSGNLVVTGDLYQDAVWGLPVITLDSNLNPVSGFFYTSNDFGSIYGASVAEAANNKIIVGGSGLAFGIDNTDGSVLWTKIFEIDQNGNNLDALGNMNTINALNAEKTAFYTSFNGSYYADDLNLHYIATAKLDANGNFTEQKAIKQVPFNSHDKYQNVFSILPKPQTDSFFIAGNMYGTNDDTGEDYHLNYLHKGNLNQMECGEEPIDFNFLADDALLTSNNIPLNLVIQVTMQSVPRAFTSHDLNPDYNNTYCLDTNLSLPDFDVAQIQIFPNPAKDMLTIQTQQTIKSVAVFDVLGKKVNVPQLSSASIDVSQLARGLYIIQVEQQDQKTFSSKFIKE